MRYPHWKKYQSKHRPLFVPVYTDATLVLPVCNCTWESCNSCNRLFPVDVTLHCQQAEARILLNDVGYMFNQLQKYCHIHHNDTNLLCNHMLVNYKYTQFVRTLAFNLCVPLIMDTFWITDKQQLQGILLYNGKSNLEKLRSASRNLMCPFVYDVAAMFLN